MTRINLVPPSELCRQHLVAEYREIARVFGLVRKAQTRGLTPSSIDIPDKYVLGPGHVKFFYIRLKFLSRRQMSLVCEMQNRGYSPKFTSPEELLYDIDDHWFNDYEPTPDAIELSRRRIAEKLPVDRRRG